MLSKDISDSVLTVGCAFHPPRGGVAQVLYNYEHYVFSDFKYIVNSGGGNKLHKLAIAINGLRKMKHTLSVDKKIKIVHIHTASYNDFWRSTYYLNLAKRCGKKVVLHIHGGGFKDFYATNPTKIARELDKCDTLVVLSASWKKWFEEIMPEKKIEVVENIVPKPDKVDREKADNRLHLLFLGLITQQKGIFDLLEVLAENKAAFNGKLCLHIGGNGEVEKLKSLIEEKQLSGMVVFEGWADEEKKRHLFSLIDAFILPSYTEGVPISILEAMSYGLPILSTKVGGIPEIVSDNENGFLFDAGDKEAMRKILIAGLEDSEKLSLMGKSASNYIENHFPDAVSARLSSIYKQQK